MSVSNSKSNAVSTDSETAMLTLNEPTATGPSSPASTSSYRPTVITDTNRRIKSGTSILVRHDTAPTVGPVGPSIDRGSSDTSSYHHEWEPDTLPVLDKLSFLDLLDNFAIMSPLERIGRGISAQTYKVQKSREALRSKGQIARERMVKHWRQRVPSAEEQLERYRRRMRDSVNKLSRRWGDSNAITLREKIAFICGVMNIFASGYLIGGYPEYFHVWYTVQLLYLMPIRIFTFHRMGYHYFLVDLCYFVNFLLFLSIWVTPHSKRLFVAVYCLAFGNNAIAIIMWRNSLVFHSLDKVTSLFIHIMPCATLHCIVHLLTPDHSARRFPGAWAVKQSLPGSPSAFDNLISMVAWSTIPYILWQFAYHFFITVLRKDKIAAGRPTSFSWLRKTYSKVWIGRVVLKLPENLQVFAFMAIQYMYTVLTMLPCPIWFHHRKASAIFLLSLFAWSVYNGSTYYIDVFGNRFHKELQILKEEVARWQLNVELLPDSLVSDLIHAKLPVVGKELKT